MRKRFLPSAPSIDMEQVAESAEKKEESLEIKALPSSKDKIKNPTKSEDNWIPRLGNSCLLNGSTGQGKSTLLVNLISDKRFFGDNSFDHKFLISPTAEGDDIQKQLDIQPGATISDLEEAPSALAAIMRNQKREITELGADGAPQIALIYDDVVSDPKFTKSPEFIKTFIASRHFNLTVFVCSQSWTAVPRRARLQAKNIFFFAASQSEIELLATEFCPPGFNKKMFIAMVDDITKEKFSFLYINKNVPMQERFRKNLGEIIDLESYKLKYSYLMSDAQTKRKNVLSNSGEYSKPSSEDGPQRQRHRKGPNS